MNVKPVLLIFTDSVALPRKYPEGKILWQETYIAKIRAHYPAYDVINVSIGGASIKDLRNQINYYMVLEPEIVLLQCGIVDAAPRAFGRLELEIVTKMRLLRFTKPFVSFLRRYRAHHYAAPKEFEQKLVALKEGLNPKRFIALGILPSSSDYEIELPGITQNTVKYNAILKKHSDHFVVLDDIPRNGILSDNHHVNAIGQQFIFEQLQKVL
ncbi:hypothetical protein [Flavobacterium sp.]|uniref:hypothetical protein n=1 Tax=Flavobacterium sp. TaxID=239 RepID=UPI002FDDB391